MVFIFFTFVFFLTIFFLFKGKYLNKKIIFFCYLLLFLFLFFILTDNSHKNRKENSKKNIFFIDKSLSMFMKEKGKNRSQEIERLLKPFITEKNITSSSYEIIYFDEDLIEKSGEDISSPSLKIVEKKKRDKDTYINTSIINLVNKYENKINSIFLFSDGNSRDYSFTTSTLDLLKKYNIKVFCYLSQLEINHENITLSEVSFPEFLEPYSEGIGEIKIINKGFKSVSSYLSIKEKNTVVWRKKINLKEGVNKIQFSLNFKNKNTLYNIELTNSLKELFKEDNQINFQVKAKAVNIKVLYLEGSDDKYYYQKEWKEAYKFFLEALESTKKIKVDTYIPSSSQYNKKDKLLNIKTLKKGIPKKRKELLQYDVIIFSDISKKNFSDEQKKAILDLVTLRGGGFAMFGGRTSFGEGGWDKTILEKIIPVDMSSKGRNSRESIMTFSSDTYSNPSLNIVRDYYQNKEILDEGIKIHGFNLIKKVKVGSKILAYASFRSPIIINNSSYQNYPVLILQNYGLGTSIAFLSDPAGGWGKTMMSSWGEKNQGGNNFQNNDYYQKFWANLVFFLAKNSLNKNKSKVVIKTDKVNYFLDEEIEIFCFINEIFLDKKSKKIKVIGFFNDQSENYFELNDVLEGIHYKAKVPSSSIENIRKDNYINIAIVDTKTKKTIYSFKKKINIIKLSREKRDTKLNISFLTKLATLSGGKVFRTHKEFEKFLEKKNKFTSDGIRPWKNWFFLISTLSIFCFLWYLKTRKK